MSKVLEAEIANIHYKHALEMLLPSRVYKPRLFIDGNRWCALYGENLQDGVAGFGESPELAMIAFDRAWHSKLPSGSEG